jgi:hypothetical protein
MTASHDAKEGTMALAQPDRYDALANSAMSENRPTPETAKVLREELLFQRATQTICGHCRLSTRSA